MMQTLMNFICINGGGSDLPSLYFSTASGLEMSFAFQGYFLSLFRGYCNVKVPVTQPERCFSVPGTVKKIITARNSLSPLYKRLLNVVHAT